jgi:hypothetical protein
MTPPVPSSTADVTGWTPSNGTATPRSLPSASWTSPADPTIDPGLLDALPTTAIDWTEVPAEVQRDLFDALQLQIRYDRATNTAHGQVTLVGDT